MDGHYVYAALLAFANCLWPNGLLAQESFDGISKDYVPAGKPAKRISRANAEDCQSACTTDPRCKGFAFKSGNSGCYLYHTVYVGGQDTKLGRQMGIYSSGLAIVRKRGFVSAFKRSSYPARPIFYGRLRGTITDVSNGAIFGATIILHWDSAGSGVGLMSNMGTKGDLLLKTDSAGMFVADVPPGFYDLFVSAIAFTPSCRKIRINEESSLEVKIPLDVDPLVLKELGDRFEVVP